MICALINGTQPTAIFENRFLRNGVLYTPLRRIILPASFSGDVTFRLRTLFLKLGSHYNLPIPTCDL
jgi:hypothetical protein